MPLIDEPEKTFFDFTYIGFEQSKQYTRTHAILALKSLANYFLFACSWCIGILYLTKLYAVA